MKNLLASILCIALYVSSYCQDTIDVFEKTVKLAGLSRETEYIGFAEGDRIIINFSVEKGKDLKDITISEYPATVKFAAHAIESIQNKVLNIPRKGIYIFDYYNSNLSARTISIKIQRIPKSEETKFFNTNIKWVNRVDTSYIAKENTYLVSSDTSFVDIIDSRVRVHSQTNLENPNKTIVDFIIPANTIKWTYWIGVGEEGQEAFKNDYAAFSKTGSKLIGAVNPLVGLAFGLFTMTHANIGENVKYYFIDTWADVQKFQADQPFMQFKNGNVVTDFGLLNLESQKNKTFYIGLVNDNTIQGIDVNVKVLAVVVNNKYNTVVEMVPAYTNRTTPIHEE